jgi:glycine cleavage system regulatory protein
MTNKYLLLNALIPQDFGITIAELKEAAEEFGCSLIISEGLRDPGSRPSTQDYYFLTGPSVKAIEQMVNQVDLTGIIVEITNVFDQAITEIHSL